jgi:hypothetical protein
VRLEGLGKLIKIIELIGSRTRDLPVCNSALTTTLPRAPLCLVPASYGYLRWRLRVFPNRRWISKYCTSLYPGKGAVSYVRRLVAGFPPRRPEFEPGSIYVGYLVVRATLGQVTSEYFGFPCHSFLPLIVLQTSPPNIQGWYNISVNGRSNSGLGSSPSHIIYIRGGPPLCSSCLSSWLQIRDTVRSSGSDTGSTQSREDNWGAPWMKSSGCGPENLVNGRENPCAGLTTTLYPQKFSHFADQRRPLSEYS